MNKYLIKIKPLDKFFFSQETKFRKKGDEYETEYYQKSALCPQQTSLLGALRFLVLKENGQIPILDKDKASQLIGSESFSIGNTEGYGLIKELSPVFVVNSNNANEIITLNSKNQLKNNNALHLKAVGENYIFENYNEKDGLSLFLQSKNKAYAIEDIFRKVETVGITKDKNKSEHNERNTAPKKDFYKQDFYTFMNNNYSFGCVVKFSKEFDPEGRSHFITLGAEQNLFRLEFEKLENWDYNSHFKTTEDNTYKTLTLTSNAYITNLKDINPIASIKDSTVFRFLESRVTEDKKYYNQNPTKKGTKGIKRSHKYNLLQIGTVFYFVDDDERKKLKDKLDSENIEFRVIGYNQYKTN